MQKEKELKALEAKYPLILLHSRQFCKGGEYKRSAYSFIYETADEKRHHNEVQMIFHNGGEPMTFVVTGGQNLAVDLGKVDFKKDPDPAKITIDHPGIVTNAALAVEGHVYLVRIRDDRGNNFYVLFQIVGVDEGSRYMAFFWRKLPGGKVVKQMK